MTKSYHLHANNKFFLLLCSLLLSISGYSREMAGMNSSVDIDQQQDAFTLKGKVSDEHGNPLPGASLVLLGSTRGVGTDLYG